jgi:hypothetical protein
LLELELAVLATQPVEFFSLGCGQPILAGQRLAAVDRSLRGPVGNGLRSAAELTRQLRRRLADAQQLKHLRSELRRIWRPGSRHVGLLPSLQ